MYYRGLHPMIKFYLIVAAILIALTIFAPADAEILYVTASELNGRARPSKSSSVEAIFEHGDSLTATGNIHGDWVEVIGGETGTVWCSAKYLSESNRSASYRNTSGGRVRTRTQPNGKASGWIDAGKCVRISSMVDGWGYIENKGWVDISYFTQVD